MKRCWPWAHRWSRDYEAESRHQEVSYTDVRIDRCTRCPAIRVRPTGRDL